MSPSLLSAPRSLPRDSLLWMRWDLPLRILPFLALPLLAVWLTPLSAATVGLTLQGAPSQLLLVALFGPAMGWLSWWYRRRIVGRMVVPTGADNALQSAYYVLLNSPAEELFFRGLLIGWLQTVTGAPAAWLISTAVFGLYHIPARWGWRSVGGVTIAGAFFGLLFLLGPASVSLVAPVLVHAFATCGFLSAGPWVARTYEARRARPVSL